MIEITLPWPDKRLSPNARVHRMEKARVTKLSRYLAKMIVYEAGYSCRYEGCDDVKFKARITYYPPDKRRRDILDNLPRSIKAFVDGVCDCIGIDDNQIRRTINEWGEVVKGGKVVLRLEELDMDADYGGHA